MLRPSSLLLCALVPWLTTARKALFKNPKDGQCANVFDRLTTVNSACGSSLTNCSVDCAGVLLPLVHNTSCMPILNNLLDKYKSDTSDDSTATTMYKFAAVCTDMLIDTIKGLKSRNCVLDTSRIIAFANTTPVAAGVPVGSRRRRGFGVVSQQSCPFHNFTAKLDAAKASCCGMTGNCKNGVPMNCSFNCAQEFPKFFADCRTMVQMADASQYPGYVALAKTCARIPVLEMISAVKGATCHATSTRPGQYCITK